MAKDKSKKKVPFNVFRKGLAGAIIGATILAGGLALTGCGKTGPQGSQGEPGKPGATWFSGTATNEEQGVVGDFFYDTDDCDIYVKLDTGWMKISNIQGLPGKDGADGKDGTDGKDGIDGTIWKSGLSCTEFADAKVGDYFVDTDDYVLYQKTADSWKIIMRNFGKPADDNVEEQNIVDLVIFMGQSNMAGRGVASQAPVVQEGHGYEFRAVSDPTQLYTIAEPFGVNENRGVLSENIKTGSLVSAFAESYYTYSGGIPIVGVSAAQGGQSINFWQTGGAALTETINRFNAANTYLTDNGYTVRHKYMVWLQGEADGVQGMSVDTYKAKLVELLGEMKEQGVEKAMIIRVGDRQSDEKLHDGIIKAQTDLCKEREDFVMISGKLAAVAAEDMKDNAHYKQETYNEVGADAGKNMAYHVNTGLEPYFYDEELGNWYPFGGSGSQTEQPEEEETVDSFVLNVSDTESKYDFSTLGTVADGKVTIAQGSSTNFIELEESVILSDDYSWTYEVVAGDIGKDHTTGAGMIANSGTSGSGFLTIPPYKPSEAPSAETAQFRFRDEGKSLQLDITLPTDYDPSKVHHFALVYDSSTKMFKAYIDKVEANITYTVGVLGGSFNNTKLKNFLGGYSTAASNFAGDFYYFGFTKSALTTDEMYTHEVVETVDSLVLDVSDAESDYDFSTLGTVADGKLTIAAGSSTKCLEMNDAVILSDNYSWTYEVVAGDIGRDNSSGAGMIANAGIDGSGFLTVPPYAGSAQTTGAQFRFRDTGRSLQLDIAVPVDYNPDKVHHFALVYNAETKTFKAYIDKVECAITYTTGSQGSAFNDTRLKNFLGGYPTADASNFAGDFYYFGFTKSALTTDEMYTHELVGAPEEEPETPQEPVEADYVLDVTDPTLADQLASLGTVADGKLTISAGSATEYLTPTEVPVLSDDYSWTVEVVAGNFLTGPEGALTGAGMIANSGTSGSGFLTVPPRTAAAADASAAQFRFRDEGKTLQIDITVPASYDPSEMHHFALVYNAATKTFKAYIDKVECAITYTTGTQGGTFNDTSLNHLLGGYSSAASNFAGDFSYFAFTKAALTTGQMYTAE
ncbi:MAG: hypothetical protein IJX00_00695 [Clostridia bacterium]|nr:hypothetical protein [Clostridia bacterium]